MQENLDLSKKAAEIRLELYEILEAISDVEASIPMTMERTTVVAANRAFSNEMKVALGKCDELTLVAKKELLINSAMLVLARTYMLQRKLS